MIENCFKNWDVDQKAPDWLVTLLAINCHHGGCHFSKSSVHLRFGGFRITAQPELREDQASYFG